MPEPMPPTPSPAPPRSIEESVKSAVDKISQYVDDVSKLQVETRYLVIGDTPTADFKTAQAAARTEIKIDGDCYTVVPIRKAANGEFVFQEALNEVHDRHVAAAIQYRKEIVGALKDVVVELGRKIT